MTIQLEFKAIELINNGPLKQPRSFYGTANGFVNIRSEGLI